MYEKQQVLVDGIINSFKGVLDTTIDKDVKFVFEAVSEIEGDKLPDGKYTKIEIGKGVQATLFLGMETHLAANFCDLMLMGEGRDEFEEEDKDAFVELSNQLMGAAATFLTTSFSKSVSIEEVSFYEEVPFYELVLFTYNVEISGITTGKLFLAVDKLKIEQFSGENGGGDDMVDDSQIKGVQFPDLGEAQITPNSGGENSLELLMNVRLKVSVELGRTEMLVKDILDLGPGSVIELNKLAGEPIDILANGTLIAKGEVVVVDENFGVRITSLVSPEERLQSVK